MGFEKSLFMFFGKLKWPFNVRAYAIDFGKKSKELAIRPIETSKLEVEKDPNKLVTYVCGTNLLTDEGEDIKIKPDAEYPEWLWTIHIGEPLPISKLDPNTKEYWLKVGKMAIEKNKYLDSLQRHKTVHK